MAKKPDHGSRAHALLSASSSSRWLACPPSAEAAELYQDTDTEYTREGTLAHEIAEIMAKGTNDFTPDQVDGADWEMVDCGRQYADYIAELSDDETVTLLEQRVEYSDWVPDGFGIADCILIKGGTIVVIDYKYGQGIAVSAEGNTQMRLYGLGAYQLLRDFYDIKIVETHIFQPRLDSISSDTITVEQLLAWAEDYVKPRAELASKGKGTYTPGEHCRFCPHAGHCRELTRQCMKNVYSHGLRAKVETMPGFEIAEVLNLESMISLWIRRVKAQALEDLLAGKEIPGYKVVEGKMGNRKWTDEAQIMRALDDAGIPRDEYTETRLLSPAAMDKALGKKRAAELLSDLTSREPGAPTVVPETDKRPPYNPVAQAQEDFA